MRTQGSASLILICLTFLVLASTCRVPVKASPATWVVDDDGPADFDKIQHAINFAASGDTILVRGGVYYEHLLVNKTLYITGEDMGSAVIDGGENFTVVTIEYTEKVVFTGFTIIRSGQQSSDSAFFIERSSSSTISYNTITANNEAFSLRHSNDNTISHNTISTNHGAVSLSFSNNNTISHNLMTHNYEGVNLYYSSLNEITSNTIRSNNYAGITFDSAGRNVLYYNTIAQNPTGVYFDSSYNNSLYLNNFNNTIQVQADQTDDSLSRWDNGYEGNFWIDYGGSDLDLDGIGDIPHTIDERNQDNSPLIGTASHLKVTSGGEVYLIRSICNSTLTEFSLGIGSETSSKILRLQIGGKDSTVGFCRVTMPTELMKQPYIVLFDLEEIFPTTVSIQNGTYVHIYLIYVHSSHNITIISSRTLHLYYDLLEKLSNLETDLNNLYESYNELNNTHQALLNNYTELQRSYNELNNTHQALLNNYTELLANHTELRNSHNELDSDFQEITGDFLTEEKNVRSLIYITTATTAIFIVITVYLSRIAHKAGRVH